MGFDHRWQLVSLVEVAADLTHAVGVDDEQAMVSIQPKGFLTAKDTAHLLVGIVETLARR